MIESLPERPRIAIVGSGAIGGYYGARIAETGGDVHFLFRSDFEAVRENGLHVTVHDGRSFVLPARAYRTTDDIGAVDLVIIATKTTSNHHLPGLLRPLVGNFTTILTLQNGMGNVEMLGDHFGIERVIGGLCFVCINRIGPGRIENYTEGSIMIGEGSGPPRKRTEQVAGIFRAAGLHISVAESLDAALWKKLVWNVPFNGLTIVCGGVPTDQIVGDPALLREVRTLMEEIRSAAAAYGHDIPPKFLDSNIERTLSMGAYKPSSLIDYLNGAPVEIGEIWSEPIRRAHLKGIAVPRLELLEAQLRFIVASNEASV